MPTIDDDISGDASTCCRSCSIMSSLTESSWRCQEMIVSSSGDGDGLSEQHLSECVHKMCRRKIGVVERARASLSKRQWICWGCIIILNQLNSWLQRVLVVCLCYCSRLLDWFVVDMFWHAFHESARRCHHCLTCCSQELLAQKNQDTPSDRNIQSLAHPAQPLTFFYQFSVPFYNRYNITKCTPSRSMGMKFTPNHQNEMPSLLNLKEKNKRRECSVKLNPIVVQTQTRALLFNHAF